MTGPLHLIALGARTAVGMNSESCAASVRAGISRVTEFAFASRSGEPIMVASDPLLDSDLEGRHRLWPMLLGVLDEVAEQLSVAAVRPGRIEVLLALPENRPGFTDEDARWLVESARTQWRRSGCSFDIRLAGRGHAGVVSAVDQAAQEARGQRDTAFLAVGVDSYVDTSTFLWLEKNRRLHQRGVRTGFVPGEGAGALLLAPPALGARMQLPPLAVVDGVGTAMETQLSDSELGASGVALSRAISAATARTGRPSEVADEVYIDINGERYRSEEWGFAMLRGPSAFRGPNYRAPGDCWGEVGAAFGALAAVLVARSFVRGYARGQTAMVLAASDAGLRGALLLKSPQPSTLPVVPAARPR